MEQHNHNNNLSPPDKVKTIIKYASEEERKITNEGKERLDQIFQSYYWRK